MNHKIQLMQKNMRHGNQNGHANILPFSTIALSAALEVLQVDRSTPLRTTTQPLMALDGIRAMIFSRLQ